MRCRAIEAGLLDTPCLLLLSLVLPVLLTVFGFFLGMRVHGELLWGGVGLSLLLSAIRSGRHLAVGAGVYAVAVVVAVYDFAYTGWDSAVCHWAQAYAIAGGWNPVLNATEGGIAAVTGGANCSLIHVLCAPKFPHIASAIVCKGMNLFVGIGFVNVVLFVTLFAVMWRFLRRCCGCTSVIAAMAAFLGSMPLELMRQTVQGYVDYCRYTTLLVAVFSYFLWRNERRLRDIVLFFAGLVLAACSKSGALIWLIVGCAVTTCLHARSIAFRRVLLCAGLAFLVLGFAPYVTEWIHNGSPFYPAHSFDASRKVIDLTADLISPATRNADALKMGWLARVIYAWISPDLAIHACRIWYGDPGFNPIFKTPFVNGLSTGFAYWLWFCAFACVFIRNRSILMVVVVVVAITLGLPTKFIGFYRYTPEIAVLPPLCLAGLSLSVGRCRLVGVLVHMAFFYLCLYALLFTASWICLELSMERLRQERFSALMSESVKWRLDPSFSTRLRLVSTARARAAGLDCRLLADKKVPLLCFPRPATYDIGLFPATSETASCKLRKDVQSWHPIYFSFYGNIFSPFVQFDRWRSYQWRLGGFPKRLPAVGSLPQK